MHMRSVTMLRIYMVLYMCLYTLQCSAAYCVYIAGPRINDRWGKIHLGAFEPPPFYPGLALLRGKMHLRALCEPPPRYVAWAAWLRFWHDWDTFVVKLRWRASFNSQWFSVTRRLYNHLHLIAQEVKAKIRICC